MDESTRQATRLWTSAQPAVAAFVASIVRDRRDREDVVQETALAVFESIGSYDPSRPFGAWAIGIARNQIGLYLRRHKRDRLIFSDETVANLEAAFATGQPRPELDHVADCIGELTGRAKTLCDLRYRDGLKPAAISEKVAMTANSVAKALQRIREQLRACIRRKTTASGVAS